MLFVGLTTIFWWGRSMSSPRDMTIKIPLTYNGLGKEIVCEQQLPKELNVVIRDNGEQLRKIKRANLHLNYEITSILNEKQGILNISAEQMRTKVQDQLPGTTKIQRIWPEQIESKYYQQAQKRVAVRVATNISLAAQYQMVGKAKVTPDSIDLYGSSAAIDSIEEVVTQLVQAEQVRESIHEEVGLQVPLHVEVSQTSVELQIQIEQFTEKTLNLPIRVNGAPEGVNMRLFPQTATIVARVGVTHFAYIDENDFEVYCEYPEQATDALAVKVKSKNPAISNIRIFPDKVEYIINK